MDDENIIQLYWQRNEQAIPATASKYGPYCTSIARNILGSWEDAEECVNDTYLRAWNSIPPHRPQFLSAFLGRITRNLSIQRYQYRTAGKRGGGTLPAVLEEIGQLVSGAGSVEQEVDRRELLRAIDAFLARLPARKRAIFIRRYWYFYSVSQISSQSGMTENQVSVTLSRLRRNLRNHLLEEGFSL